MRRPLQGPGQLLPQWTLLRPLLKPLDTMSPAQINAAKRSETPPFAGMCSTTLRAS